MPFTKGDPNINRKGAPPKEWTWAGVVRTMMEESEEDGEPVKVKVARALKLKAFEGDVLAIKEIGNRIDGMPKQSTDITTNGKDLPTPLLATLDVSNNYSSQETEDTE